MPSVHGGVTEETKEEIEKLIEDGVYDNQSELVEFCIEYTLKHKHGR